MSVAQDISSSSLLLSYIIDTALVSLDGHMWEVNEMQLCLYIPPQENDENTNEIREAIGLDCSIQCTLLFRS
jgi:hypothetical protein